MSLDHEPPVTSQEPRTPAPIADLSYRSYDGPIRSHPFRPWTVAVTTLRMMRGRWQVWLLMLAAALPYLFYMLMLYLGSRFGGGMADLLVNRNSHSRYTSAFNEAYQAQLFWLMVMALTVGAGSIANDNRTNALQVYLAKPLTKQDYLFGKWLGIFVAVYAAALLPALLMYLFCLLSYLDDGFLRNEPWLIAKILLACAMPAAIHAGLLVGVSAWSKSALIAGAVYAGVYFASSALSAVLWFTIYGLRSGESLSRGILLQHASVAGIIKAAGWCIYGVSAAAGGGGPRGLPITVAMIEPPNRWLVAAITLAVVAVGVGSARLRIRAVEVVKG